MPTTSAHNSPEREPRFHSFAEFWPWYLAQHQTVGCRVCHYFAAAAALALIGCGCAFRAHGLLLWIPLVSYGFAWTGHVVFERNRPATWSYAIWSLRAEGRMLRLFVSGGLERELQELPKH